MKIRPRHVLLLVTAATAFGLSVGVGLGLQLPHRNTAVATGGAPPAASTGQTAPSADASVGGPQSAPLVTGSQLFESDLPQVSTGPGGFPLPPGAQLNPSASRAAQALLTERGFSWLISDPSFSRRNLQTVAVYQAAADASRVRAFYDGNPPGTPWYMTSGGSMEFTNGATGDSAIVQMLSSAQAGLLGVPAQSFVLLIFG